MATAKEKKQMLDEWAKHFPLHVKWKNRLIRKHGAVISGICLEETRDPKYYSPTFFIHNLLIPFPVITLAYSALLLSNAGVGRTLKYGILSVSDVDEFKHQINLSYEDITFGKYVEHIVGSYYKRYGNIAVYLPHALRDIITVGSYLGDANYYLSSLDKSAVLLESKSSTYNLRIIGSISQWVDDVRVIIEQNHDEVIQNEINVHKLPPLQDVGMAYKRIENYWDMFTQE